MGESLISKHKAALVTPVSGIVASDFKEACLPQNTSPEPFDQ
ncbi:hypothetical protein ABIE91_003042 [Bradyrhizobium elkanii]|jgi:hypothetical protein